MVVTHSTDTFGLDRRWGAVVLRGCAWGGIAGAVSGALFVLPLVLWNGPWAALLVYPPLAALPGAAIGLVIGALVGAALVSAEPSTTWGARGIGAFTTALCLAWIPWLFGSGLGALWLLVIAAGSGALAGPRVSARRSGVAAAAGRASPGSSPAPGR